MDIDYIERKVDAYLNGYEFSYEFDPLPEQLLDGVKKSVSFLTSDTIIIPIIKDQLSEDSKPIEVFPSFLQDEISSRRKKDFLGRVKERYSREVISRVSSLSPWSIYYKSGYNNTVKEDCFHFLKMRFPFLEETEDLKKWITREKNNFKDDNNNHSVVFIVKENTYSISVKATDEEGGKCYIIPPENRFDCKYFYNKINECFPRQFKNDLKYHSFKILIRPKYVSTYVDEDEFIYPTIIAMISAYKDFNASNVTIASRFNILGDLKYTDFTHRELREVKLIDRDFLFVYGSDKFYDIDLVEEFGNYCIFETDVLGILRLMNPEMFLYR